MVGDELVMTSMIKAQKAEIRVVGVVQGIGFRPFIYNQATKRQLKGFVINIGNSAVQIIVEGEKKKIIEFIESIEKEKPHLAVIDTINTIWSEPTGQYSDFQIQISRDEARAGGSIIPADISICEECLNDVRNPESRHYQYPFTCCAICGPRYTTITSTPYDRERTTMEDFSLCKDCNKEFNDPAYRRYNAQTICCPRCGPKFHLLDSNGDTIDSKNVFSHTTQLLNEGAIVAVKGLGGIHLAVRASLEDQVQRLRVQRRKPFKPLAIMSSDLQSIKQFGIITQGAAQLLTSWRRPIVVIKKKSPFPLSPSLAPDLDTIGVMLPYSGIYYRLFDGLDDLALVMTSANPVGLPTIIRATSFQEKFMKMADYFLTHNRTIYQRCDDSVIIPYNDRSLIIRRSRGYTPEPIETATTGPPVLAVGALEKNTGAIYNKRRIYLTQHIGDVDTLETMNFFQESLAHLQKLLRVDQFNAIACDLHPDFLTTQYAHKFANEHDIPLFLVQHHHAHLASILADYNLEPDEKIVAICCDGAGYGEDRTIWGGEILVGNSQTYSREGHLRPHPMPGGDLAAKYPIRMAIGILSKEYPQKKIYQDFKDISKNALEQGVSELNIVLQQTRQDLNTPFTSSTGRILDALSALLGVCYKRTYEGEPAIKFEAYANSGKPNSNINLSIPETHETNSIVLETGALVDQIYRLRSKYKGPDLALASHRILGKKLADTAVKIAKKHGIENIGFSGGVAYNIILTNIISRTIKQHGLNFLIHRNVPPGDAGTSIGQSMVARSRFLLDHSQ